MSNDLELAWVMPSSTRLTLQGILLILQAFYNGLFGFLHPGGAGLCSSHMLSPSHPSAAVPTLQCCRSYMLLGMEVGGWGH